MPYLIDGHNLIGKLPDIDLNDPEDEMQLIQKLRDLFKRKRISGTVYFDQRGPGMKRKYTLGRLQIEFSTPPNTADSAIQSRLRQLKKNASNYIVVSSDHQIMDAARAAGAQVLDSQTFAQQLVPSPLDSNESEKPESPLSSDELRRWQKLFERDHDVR